jgi:thymidylate synthase ThyX
MYKAEILADSLSPQGHRITTMKITFPRFILAEMNTHRVFSRNSASSRAIPFNKMVKRLSDHGELLSYNNNEYKIKCGECNKDF